MINDFNLIDFLNKTGFIYLMVIIAFALIVKIGTVPRISKK